MLSIRALFIDDDESRWTSFRSNWGGNCVWVKTAAEAKECIEAQGKTFDVLFFDHDLQDYHYLYACAQDEETGYSVAKWLVANKEKVKDNAFFVIHSLNPVGAERISNALVLWARRVHPFVWTNTTYLSYIKNSLGGD